MPPTDLPVRTSAVAASLATTAPAAKPPAAAPPPAEARLAEEPAPLGAEPAPFPAVGAFGGAAPLPVPPGPPLDPPSSTLLRSAPGRRLIGIGSGRLSADLASCSADIAWYT